jgi:hypothetical protein
MVVGGNIKWEAAFNAPSGTFRGLPLGITETGLGRSSNGGVTEEQMSRFDLRQFLVFAGSDVHPIVFYRLTGDKTFEWLHPDHSPYPVYTAFQGLMKDLGTIANAPPVPFSVTTLPTIGSYAGTYPLAMAIFVGSRIGDSMDSFAVYTWQRSYSSGRWIALPSPSVAQVSMYIPKGLTVEKVVNTVTSSALHFNVDDNLLVYPVTDDPVEIMLVPRR